MTTITLPAITASTTPLYPVFAAFTRSGSNLTVLQSRDRREGYVLLRESGARLNFVDRFGQESIRTDLVRVSRHETGATHVAPDGDARLYMDGGAYYQSTQLMWAMDYTRDQRFRPAPHHRVIEDARQYCRRAPQPLQAWVDEAHAALEVRS